MEQQENCQGCEQRHRCQEIYQRLGEVKGPSVVSKVVVAFLLPMVVFIIVLAAFEQTLAKVISKKELQTVCGLLSALAATSVCILITEVIKRRFRQK